MKKNLYRVALLAGLVLCSERVQAVSVLFDGQVYELSDTENIRYGSVSRRKPGETEEAVNARLKAFFAPLDHKIITPVPPVESITQKKVRPPVAAKPKPPVPAVSTQEQLDAAAATRAAATPAPVAHQAVATAASASAAQADEHEPLSAGEKKALELVGNREAQINGLNRIIRTQGRSDSRVQQALENADIAMKAESSASQIRGLSQKDLDEMYVRQVQEEDNQEAPNSFLNPDEEADVRAAIMASIEQSTSPALSTRSVTPPVVLQENVRPGDVQYTEVMVVPGELGSQLTPAEIVERNEDLMKKELALADAAAIAATERMLAQESADEARRNEDLMKKELALADAEAIAATERMLVQEAAREQRKGELSLAYKKARALQQEMELIELLRAFTTGFTREERLAFKKALVRGLEEAALLEVLDSLS